MEIEKECNSGPKRKAYKPKHSEDIIISGPTKLVNKNAIADEHLFSYEKKEVKMPKLDEEEREADEESEMEESDEDDIED